MRITRVRHVGLLLWFLATVASAQYAPQPERFRAVATSADTLVLDTLSIIPESFSATDALGLPLPQAFYEIDYWNARWIWKIKPDADSVWCRYRVFPLLFTRPMQRKNYDELNRSDSIMAARIYYAPSELLLPQATADRLTYSGSYARGLSFGNNQDLVVNSSFNLQLQGKLAGDVEVTAAMSDNNVPLQPEGNTQQLQDFDRIFIQFRKDRHALTVGDYELNRPPSYFMNFYKKLQGVSYQGSYSAWGAGQQTRLSAAAARGKYVRKEFQGQEGNQGPYRLGSAVSESYAVILAGTERVFIDGELMVRGADRDYVIDYNLGEIIFMPRRLITKDKRIIVEYQQAERAYLRTVALAAQQISWQQATLRFAVYNEQDARNQPLQQALTDSQKAVLERIGNRLELAVAPGWDSTGFRSDRPMYRRTDSLGYDVFVYSTDPDRAHYDVRFSYVGPARGNYRISSEAVNGRVYYWVAPQAGQPQGDYEPYIPLIAPQRQQMITVGADVNLGARTTLTAETALSNNDVNTFSATGNSSNAGGAGLLKVQSQLPFTGTTRLLLQSSYEVVARSFRPVEWYRPVEFVRDWNLGTKPDTADEHLAGLSLQLQDGRQFQTAYRMAALFRGNGYRGVQNGLGGSWSKGGFSGRAEVSYLLARADSLHSAFLRPLVDLSQQLTPRSSVRLGLKTMQELNRFFLSGNDSLLASSFFWNEETVYVRNSDTALLHWNFSLTHRDDHAPRAGRLQRATTGNSVSWGLLTRPGRQQLELLATYRRLTVADTSLTANRPDNAVLLRLRHDGSVQKGFIMSSLLYETNIGQVQKQEFAYVPVAVGSGTHIWIDYNGDGIQQIHEFELAPFASDGAFLKVFLPTNEYVRCYNVQFNESLTITPRHLFGSPAGQRSVWSRFSALLTAQLNQRTYGRTWLQQFSPIGLSLADSLLLSAAALTSATLYFNRTHPHFGADVFWQGSRSKNLLTNGLEARQQSSWGGRLRWNANQKWALLSTAQLGRQERSLEYLPAGNFRITGYELSPQLSYLPRNTFRLALTYRYRRQQNVLADDGEQVRMHQGETELRYNVLARSAVAAKFTLAQVDFSGSPNSPAGYALLQGLQRGTNFLSQISAERQLTRLLELMLVYENRKTGTARWVHTGRMQVRALF